MKCHPRTLRASGQVYDKPCWFINFKIGIDNANDVQLTVSDTVGAPGATDTELVPTNPYDASAMGLNGISGDESYARNGIYLTMEAVGGGAYGLDMPV